MKASTPAIPPQFFSISPKLLNSYPDDRHTVELSQHRQNNLFDQLPHFMNSNSDYQFKFVVESRDDTGEIMDLISRFGIPRDEVCLLPQATTARELSSRGRIVAASCRNEGLNFSGRLHIAALGQRARHVRMACR